MFNVLTLITPVAPPKLRTGCAFLVRHDIEAASVGQELVVERVIDGDTDHVRLRGIDGRRSPHQGATHTVLHPQPVAPSFDTLLRGLEDDSLASESHIVKTTLRAGGLSEVQSSARAPNCRSALDRTSAERAFGASRSACWCGVGSASGTSLLRR